MYRVYIEDGQDVGTYSSIIQAKLVACRLADELDADNSNMEVVCIHGDDYDSDVPSAKAITELLADYGNDTGLLDWADFREFNM